MLQLTSNASDASLTRGIHLWPHAAIVMLLLVTQFFARDLWATIYIHVVRPRLVEQGARGCETLVRVEGQPEECDLVIEHRSTEIVEHTFYAKRGVSKTDVRSTATGQFLRSSSVHWAGIASLILPFLAFIVFASAVVHKMIRTRSIFTWQMARHRWDVREKMMLLYSVPLIVAGIVTPWLHT
jgi:hypothetical protein